MNRAEGLMRVKVSERLMGTARVLIAFAGLQVQNAIRLRLLLFALKHCSSLSTALMNPRLEGGWRR